MDTNVVLYAKQTGKGHTPITARIIWLADGTIMPLKFWLPDNLCLKVTHIYESTPLGYLKNKGNGICFKVEAIAADLPESYTELTSMRRDVCLYFAHKMFCGKNIIDRRYAHDGKLFIPVVMDVFSDAKYELVCFWKKGMRYIVEKNIGVEPCGSFIPEGIGLKHKVEARLVNHNNDNDPIIGNSIRRPASLYFGLNKWFVCSAKK